jgi:hypothetical protein
MSFRGDARAVNLRCAIAHRGIPRFRVCAFVLMAASVRIEESFKKRKQQDLLDRIAAEV